MRRPKWWTSLHDGALLNQLEMEREGVEALPSQAAWNAGYQAGIKAGKSLSSTAVGRPHVARSGEADAVAILDQGEVWTDVGPWHCGLCGRPTDECENGTAETANGTVFVGANPWRRGGQMSPGRTVGPRKNMSTPPPASARGTE